MPSACIQEYGRFSFLFLRRLPHEKDVFVQDRGPEQLGRCTGVWGPGPGDQDLGLQAWNLARGSRPWPRGPCPGLGAPALARLGRAWPGLARRGQALPSLARPRHRCSRSCVATPARLSRSGALHPALQIMKSECAIYPSSTKVKTIYQTRLPHGSLMQSGPDKFLQDGSASVGQKKTLAGSLDW